MRTKVSNTGNFVYCVSLILNQLTELLQLHIFNYICVTGKHSSLLHTEQCMCRRCLMYVALCIYYVKASGS
jgi:hypothetical protein